MDLQTLRKECMAAYGLGYADTTDDFFDAPFMTAAINEVLNAAAEENLQLRSTIQGDLTANSPTVTLSTTAIRVIPETAQVKINGHWRDVQPGERRWLRRYYGPIEELASGIPCHCNFDTDAATGAPVVTLFPPPQTTTANGFQVEAYVTPTALAGGGDAVPLPGGNAYRLKARVCLKMAEADAGRGRKGNLAYWQQEAAREQDKLSNLTRHHRRSGPRRVNMSGYRL